MRKHIFNCINEGILKVKVIPNSSRDQIREVRNDTLIVSLKAPPEDGKANESLIKFLKKQVGIEFVIKSGKTSQNKILVIV
jgi:uncharacterized protein (TIGR00251 family)